MPALELQEPLKRLRRKKPVPSSIPIFSACTACADKFFPLCASRKGAYNQYRLGGGVFSIPYQAMYSASKSAMKAYTEALRIEARDWGIRAVLVEPGDTRTGFTDNRYYTAESENTSYPRSKSSIEKMEQDERSGKNPEIIARLTARLMNRKNPPVRVTAGLEYKIMVQLKRIVPDRFVEFMLRKLYA